MEYAEPPPPDDDVFTSNNSPLVNRPSRIHFPENELNSRRLEGPSRTFSPTFSDPPARRGSPLNPDRVSRTADARRRTRPINVPNSPADSPRQRRLPTLGAEEELRETSSKLSRDAQNIEHEVELEAGVFSNEYDLYPRILQDVQRALKMKARREARMKKGNLLSPTTSAIQSLDVSPDSLKTTSPSRPTYSTVSTSTPSSPTPARKVTSTTPEVDFSPNTAISSFNSSQRHPTPSSPDNGMTLDWGTASDEDKHERRWTISTSRRKEKDKVPPLGLIVDRQEQMHEEKLDRIKTVATPQTLHKAAVTGDQLGRRYGLILGDKSSRPVPWDLAKVSRWYRSQSDNIRYALEAAEPFTWLRHLDKRVLKTKRSTWHLSALMMEEYLHAHNRGPGPMYTIPEDNILQASSPGASHISPSSTLSPNVGLWQPNGSPSDGRVSFGDSRTTPVPTSLEVDSRKSTGSSFSSIVSRSSNLVAVSLSPTTSRVRSQDTGISTYIGPGNESDVSSAHNSFSERSDTGVRKETRSPFNEPSRSVDEVPSKPDTKPANSQDVTAGGLHPVYGESSFKLTAPSAASGYSDDADKHSMVLDHRSLVPTNRTSGHRRVRVSLPSADRSSDESKRHLELEEDNLRHDYQIKAMLLEETRAHNHRMRQLLNRISAGVKEYEATQSNAMKSVGIQYKGLPRELVDAFGHDPAAVTGATRRFKGWRAVDDIHSRLLRQRQVFQAFLCQASNHSPDFASVLDGPITSLVQSLKVLDGHKDAIALRATQVTNLLKTVQTTHAEVKKDYNNTLSDTSVVYPELSHIIALEESYRDQYQQFWEFGMDALTFLLDTVTPVWRTYGKRVGEDVRDFLIIPLYRNEFTGESRRYGISEFPKRSFRHWLGLILFFLSSIGVNILQIRAAISSYMHSGLQWIPYEGVRWTALPFFWIGILLQWLAVIIEFSIVFMQLGVITWWAGWSIKVFT